MFHLDKPNMFASTPETMPILDYLWKAVDYMNMALNAIDAAQMDRDSLKQVIKDAGTGEQAAPNDIFRAYASRMTFSEDMEVDDGSMSITLNLRKYMGLVFIHVGPTMSNIPVNTTTDLGTLPDDYKPAKLETMDWTDPNGERYRLHVYANGNVKIQNFNNTLNSSITTNIHMVFPAATL